MLKIYKASAGSGKTYTLAREYIQSVLGVKIPETETYCLNHPKYNRGYGETENRHRHILAITFTNKATEEMKRRIVAELDALTRMPRVEQGKTKDANYGPYLCEVLHCQRDELAQTAQKALTQLLHDYDSFQVTTIDSFFQRVLRTFARELDRQGDYDVEIDDSGAVHASVGAMLDDYNRSGDENSPLGRWIYDFLVDKIAKGVKSNFFNRSSNIYNSLVTLVSKICDERFKAYSEEMLEYLKEPRRLGEFRKQLTAYQKEILQEVTALATRALAELEAYGVSKDSIKSQKALKLLDSYFLPGIPAEMKEFSDQTAQKIIDGTAAFFYAKAKAPKEATGLLSSFFNQAYDLSARYRGYEQLAESIQQLYLLSYTWSYLHQYILDNNLILLSDTNHILKRIIGEDETPFIYERMGVQLQHYLIDEFQDTSAMQWENLRPLVANSIYTGDNLIIGDEKQSIYRFRNSDSSLLHDKVPNHHFPAPAYPTEIKGSAPGENTNYRSARDVVRFNNTLFTILAHTLDVTGYENVIQDISGDNKTTDGYVRFFPNEGKSEDPELLHVMAKEMLRQHDEGGYKWSDIAVLTKKNDEGAAVIEHLINNYPQIPVLSDEALFVNRSKAVQLIVSVLHILAGSQTTNEAETPAKGKPKRKTPAEIQLALNRFGYYMERGLADDEALECAVHPDKATDTNDLADQIERVRTRKTSTLVSLVETIVHEVVPANMRDRDAAYISAFQDYVIDYTARNSATLRGLLHDWNSTQHSLSVGASADIDAVRVMTIHKSKGLEFDCIHIPYCDWKLETRGESNWYYRPDIPGVSPEVCPPALYVENNRYMSQVSQYFYDNYQQECKANMMDKLNMTYVAFTRAGRELMAYYDPKEGIGSTLSLAFDTTIETQDDRLLSPAEYYDPQTKEFCVGSATEKKVIKKAEARKAEDIMTVDSYQVYLHEDAEILTRLDDVLDPQTDITGEDATKQDYVIDEKARAQGLILHDILSQINTPDDLDKAIERVSISRRLSDEDVKDARKFITDKMLYSDLPEVSRWFGGQGTVLCEQAILLPEDYVSPNRKQETGRVVDVRRPDRLIFYTDGSVDVIDYKFTTEVRSSHRHQIKEYVHILQLMGYPQVRPYLWYPMRGEIVPVMPDHKSKE